MRNSFRKMTAILLCLSIVVSFILITPIDTMASEVGSLKAGTPQKAMFIMENLNISQGINGPYSHMGSKAIDFIGKGYGKDPAYAPFDGKVVYVSTSAAYIVYQSTNPVEFADGTVDYMTVMVVHDDNVGRFYVGQTFSQGEHFFNEGSSGFATGDHIHLECARGTYQGQYQNSSGVWCIKNQINPYDALYLSESTNIIDGYGYNWRRINADKIYVDLGTDFYALITHMASWNHLTNEANGNVDICWENYTANQYWKFYRQTDGSYIIKNAKTGKCLEVEDGSSKDGTNIQVWEENNSDAQKWYIYRCGNGYQLKAKCTDCVMEMNAWNFYQGVNLVSGFRDGSDAEIFAINKKDFNTVGKTELQININGIDTVFTWDNAWCSTNYNIQIYRGTSISGNPYISLWDVKNNLFTYYLEDGTYTAYLECYNALGNYINSSPKTFEINVNPSGYIDLGTDFYATISHLISGKYLTAQTNGNVNICSDTNIANQYWKFYRQGDGSYKIKSASTGKCIEVSDGNAQDGVNIQVNEANETFAQSWYIYPCGNGYQLKAKCTTCVMEMNSWGFYEGVNLVSGSRDGSDSEIFAINCEDFSNVGNTSLNCKPNYSNVTFTWSSAKCSTNYNIKVWQGDSIQPGEAPINLWNVKNYSFVLNLDEGTYTAYIESYNPLGDYVQSKPITFSIEKSPFEIGDTNLDDAISINDVTAIQCYLAKLEIFTDEQISLADTNGDGKINIEDATQLQLYLSKFDVTLG